MDAKKLEILIKAIDMGSFSKAAESVGYTQSGITHLVNSLEKEIGFRLVNRTFNGISLTKEGEILLPYIRDFLEANDDLSIKIKEIKGEEESTVRVAAYASIAMRWMPEVLYRYKRVCPGVDVDLRMVDNTLEPFELLIEGKTDVIFASRQDYDNISWTPLYDETMYAIVPEAYPDREYFDIADFKDKDNLVDAIYAVHDGVIRMIPAYPDVVETSSNLAIIDIEGGKTIIKLFPRSAREDMKDYVTTMISSCFSMALYQKGERLPWYCHRRTTGVHCLL